METIDRESRLLDSNHADSLVEPPAVWPVLPGLTISDAQWHLDYWPLAVRLYQIHQSSKQSLWVSVDGCEAVGKSTFITILSKLLLPWCQPGRVITCCVDDFLYSGEVLDDNGLAQQAGFPGTHDLAAFKADIISATSGYGHASNQTESSIMPAIYLIEGGCLIESAVPAHCTKCRLFLEADVADCQHWFVQRFNASRGKKQVKLDNSLSGLEALYPEQQQDYLSRVWHDRHLENYQQHILPAKKQADCCITIDHDHACKVTWLR